MRRKSVFHPLKFYSSCLLVLSCFTQSCKSVEPQDSKERTNEPIFSNFAYKGDDKVYRENPVSANKFYTSILQGCYPDPAITRKGDDYFLVNSSFTFFPGVPIFHSKDLVNWKQIGHVLDRPSQLKVENTLMNFGVYAPAIKYNQYNDTFYMITTQFSGGFGNIVVKTKDPFKGWSDPIKLQFDGIDPSMFFDDNGKAYVVHNDAPAKEAELYNGHRVIKIWDYDLENDRVVPGTDKIIVNGGVDISKKPIWIEAPHIYKKNGRYYLMCAEGGTGGAHSEVIFSSDNPRGPYTPAPKNPILTQRHLPANRPDKVDWAGHADLVEGPDGKYYGVFLGIRPNEKDRVNTGRETFILPVDWTGEFPVFENGLEPMPATIKTPAGVVNKKGDEGFFPSGNFEFKDNFDNEKLDYRWVGVRGPREHFVHSDKKGGIRIKPFTVNISEVKPTSTLFYRQQHNNFSAEVAINYQPNSEKDLAGLVCMQNEKFNYVFGITKKGKTNYIVLQHTQNGIKTIVASEKVDINKPLHLQVKANGDNYEFAFKSGTAGYTTLGGIVSGDILSTNVAQGFTGNLIGLYATLNNNMDLSIIK